MQKERTENNTKSKALKHKNNANTNKNGPIALKLVTKPKMSLQHLTKYANESESPFERSKKVTIVEKSQNKFLVSIKIDNIDS